MKKIHVGLKGTAESDSSRKEKRNGSPLSEGPLGKTADSRMNVRHLLEIVEDLDANSASRQSAFRRIIAEGEDPRHREFVIEELRAALEQNLGHAALALGHLRATEAIDDLKKAAGDSRGFRLALRRNAIRALGTMGEEARSATVTIGSALWDSSTQSWAADALAKMGRDGASVLLSAFILRSNNTEARLLAAEALGKMGRSAESALPELERRTRLTREWNGEIRRAARDAIEKIREDIDADGKKAAS